MAESSQKASKKSKRASSRRIQIDHTNQLNHRLNQRLLQNKSLTDIDTDIKFVIDGQEINAHKEVIEILELKDIHKCLKNAIEEEERPMDQTNGSEAVNVFEMCGTTFIGFELLLQYIYTGRVDCSLASGIELATTADKLKFHPLVASLVQHLAEHKIRSFNVYTIDDLYHIAKSVDNKDLMKSCVKFLDDMAYDLNGLFLKRDIQSTDGSNVLIYAFDRSRYNNYIHFCLPEKIEICLNISVSSDRTNWSVVLKNEQIWSRFWNWVYFEEQRLKYIRIEFIEQKGNKRFNVRHLKDGQFLVKRANVELEFDKETNYLIPKHDIMKFPVWGTKFFFDYTLDDGFTYCMSSASTKDKERKYYYHNVGDEHHLEFYLSQTCLIDKFRLRLWDLRTNYYDFKVEIKNEVEEDWREVMDTNGEVFRRKASWQTINLKGWKAVRWIKITGLKSPDDDSEFAVIDIICPSL